jgi:hypothetical protein
MAFDSITGFLNDSTDQISVLLVVGSGLTGPAGAQVDSVNETNHPNLWSVDFLQNPLSTGTYDDGKNWVVLQVKRTEVVRQRHHHHHRGELSEQLTITISITPLTSEGPGTPVTNNGSPATISVISDQLFNLIAVAVPIP